MAMVPEDIMRRRLTYEDYQALPDDADYEIVDGVLYVAPRPSYEHQVVVGNLYVILRAHVGNRLGRLILDADLLRDAQHSYVSPDILYFSAESVAGLPLKEWGRVIPALIVEVLSPSSWIYDRNTKRELYQALGVPHYWIADPTHRQLSELVLGPDGEYRERTADTAEPFLPELFPDLTVDLNEIFE